TFSAPAMNDLPAGEVSSGQDPVVAGDSNGNFWLTWFASRTSGHRFGDVVHVARFNTAQGNFDAPLDLSTPGNQVDKPWIIADDAGKVVVTWKEIAPDGSRGLYSATSVDSGHSFAPRVLITSGNTGFPCFDAAATLRGPIFLTDAQNDLFV